LGIETNFRAEMNGTFEVPMLDERGKINEQQRQVTQRLTRRALRLAIEIPRKPGWWYENEDFYGGKTLEEIELSGGKWFLTEDGIAGAEGLISAKMREIREARIRLACQVITTLIGLAGALIGMFAILKK